MKRFTFLASLFGLPLLGQKRAEVDCTGDKCDSGASMECRSENGCMIVEPIDLRPRYVMEGREIHWFSSKALNNQCPTCGTMAEPYSVLDLSGKGSRQVLLGPAEQLIRCKKCNAAFFQDANIQKP